MTDPRPVYPHDSSDRNHAFILTRTGQRLVGFTMETQLAGQTFLSIHRLDAPPDHPPLQINPSEVAQHLHLTLREARLVQMHQADYRRVEASGTMGASRGLLGLPFECQVRDHALRHGTVLDRFSMGSFGRWACVTRDLVISEMYLKVHGLSLVAVRLPDDGGEPTMIDRHADDPLADPLTLWWPLTPQGEMLSRAQYQPEAARVTLGVQWDDKTVGTINLAVGATEAEALECAHAMPALEGRVPLHVEYRPGKILKLYAQPRPASE